MAARIAVPGGVAIADAGSETVGKQHCGKAVFTDLHAGGPPAGDVPALEYLFFDRATIDQSFRIVDDLAAASGSPRPILT